MRADSFFDQATPSSRIKIDIVTNYFKAWANVMVGTQRKRGEVKPLGYV